ncbi:MULTISPECIES: GNAT family N-acetyltransferase [unclassified Isoptericola]|uniref:GNAT family N-acetyltransferase n=1 Tax=unclassified Isoptericola TaxID=2623355 RepID=UPI003657C254
MATSPTTPVPALPDGFELTADPARIDAGRVHALLVEHAYWAAGRPRELQDRALAGSRNYAVLAPDGATVAYARLVTDGATFGWLADVIVDPDHRGRGLGTAVVAAAMEDVAALGLARVLLRASEDGRPVYDRLGFTPVPEPGTWLVRASTPATTSA